MLWDGDSPTEDACAEAEAIGAGRFDGLCTARFKRVLNGFAVTVRRALLASCPKPLQPAREMFFA